MKPASRKQKGRRHQQAVRDAILLAFPSLEPDDVRSASMGANGEDILLSPAARALVPFSIECKARKTFQGLYAMVAQARANAADPDDEFPLVVLRQDRSESLALLEWSTFLAVLRLAALGGEAIDKGLLEPPPPISG